MYLAIFSYICIVDVSIRGYVPPQMHNNAVAE